MGTAQKERTGAILPLQERQDQEWPLVSIIMPVFNEENFIQRSLVGVLEQDYPHGNLEIIISDGMSTDRTREMIKELQSDYPNICLIDNPKRIVPTGLNLAIRYAHGEIIVRLDGHCEYPKDYVRSVVGLQGRIDADNVGGVLVPVGTGYVQKAVATAYYSPVGLGGAALKASNDEEVVRDVDAVHGGCWKRQRLLEVGGFDESMVRDQDDELSFRLRKCGGRIVQSLAIRVRYHVRNSFKNLFLQFVQYGFWKVQVIRKHPRQAGVRHFIPALFVLALLGTALLSPFYRTALWTMVGLIGSYVSIISLASIIQTWMNDKKLWPGVVLAVISMQIGYGAGFLLGLLRTFCGILPARLFEKPTR